MIVTVTLKNMTGFTINHEVELSDELVKTHQEMYLNRYYDSGYLTNEDSARELAINALVEEWIKENYSHTWTIQRP